MQVRPQITLLFVLSVFTILLTISFIFYVFLPEDKTSIELVGNISIKFPTPPEIFSKAVKYADISEIIAENEVVEDSTPKQTKVVEQKISHKKKPKAKPDSIAGKTRKLEFPNGDRSLLYSVFYDMDSALSKGEVVRIIHYGDSQIEGDRITSFFRNKIQEKFGGSGVGLIPASQMYDFSYSVLHDASTNWNRYTLYGNVDTLIRHKRYGILAGFNTFTPQPSDTSNHNKRKKTAWISIEKSPYSYPNTKAFNQCRLFYGNNSQPFEAKLYVNDEFVDSGTYPPSKQLKQIRWKFNDAVGNIMLEFEGTNSPEIYCLALDGLSGVAVDNVAMRGCAGLVFNKTNPELFSSLVNKLDVKLIILQFGGNVVPNIRKDYSYYERWFYAQLKFIRTYAPGVQIIVIGVADMSMKKNDSYVSYPNIELVRDAMKKATFKADAIYWDMYEAMGGKNSMPSWVFAQPPLAGSDFVHFNPRGVKIIANMFYNAFMMEYDNFKKQTQKNE